MSGSGRLESGGYPEDSILTMQILGLVVLTKKVVRISFLSSPKSYANRSCAETFLCRLGREWFRSYLRASMLTELSLLLKPVIWLRNTSWALRPLHLMQSPFLRMVPVCFSCSSFSGAHLTLSALLVSIRRVGNRLVIEMVDSIRCAFCF